MKLRKKKKGSLVGGRMRVRPALAPLLCALPQRVGLGADERKINLNMFKIKKMSSWLEAEHVREISGFP